MKIIDLLLTVVTMGLLSSCAGLMRAKKEYVNETHYHYTDSILLSFGWCGNSGVIEFDSFFVIIDTKMNSKSNQFYQLIKERLAEKKLYIINTHLHHDHTSGNFLYKADSIFIPNYNDTLWNNLNFDNLPNKTIVQNPENFTHFRKTKFPIAFETKQYVKIPLFRAVDRQS